MVDVNGNTNTNMSSNRVEEIPEKDFWNFTKSFDTSFQSLDQYEKWKQELSILRDGWIRKSERLALLGAKTNGKLIGIMRILRVPFYERKSWGFGENENEKERGEIQDIYPKGFECLQLMIDEAEKIMYKNALSTFAISDWRNWDLLKDLGFGIYSRSVLLHWDTTAQISGGNNAVEINFGTKKDVLEEIQKSSWGFFVSPVFKKQDIVLAFLKGEPVGCAYLNRFSGNIDYGVHVKKEHQRRGIGTSILKSALNYYRKRNFKRMFVIRNFRSITRVNESDRGALKFYIDCGGEVLREYRGFRMKRQSRKIRAPDISEYIGG
jgi:GNAT superfamily N-acetyltransferase